MSATVWTCLMHVCYRIGWSSQCNAMQCIVDGGVVSGMPSHIYMPSIEPSALQLHLQSSNTPGQSTMTSLCARCAVRAQRAAASPSTRPFSSTTTRNSHAIPLFTPTPSPELDHVLSELRTKHLIPAAMTNPQRRLIFGTKNREELANNPQSIEIAGEEIQLQWMDRRKEIPNRTKLFDQAMKLMEQDGSRESWSNLPKLLGGFKRNKIHVTEGQMQRVVRKAVDTGNLGSVLACLRAAEDTGMTLQQPAVLKAVILALHKEGQKGGWTKEGLEKALSDSRSVAQLLESEAHGGGHVVREGDLRQDPRVVGVFLELSAVYAWKFQGGEDVDGKVRAYTERLMYNIGGARTVRFDILLSCVYSTC